METLPCFYIPAFFQGKASPFLPYSKDQLFSVNNLVPSACFLIVRRSLRDWFFSFQHLWCLFSSDTILLHPTSLPVKMIMENYCCCLVPSAQTARNSFCYPEALIKCLYVSSSVLERSGNEYVQKLTWSKNFIFVYLKWGYCFHKKWEAFFFFLQCMNPNLLFIV